MPSQEKGLSPWRGLGGRPRLRPARPEEAGAVEGFARALGLKTSALYTNLYILEVPGARYYDAFDVPDWAVEVAREAGSFSAGFYIGRVEGGSFTPGLPLAFRLSRLCGITIECHRVDEFGEKVFLYGKPVYEEHVTAWAPGLSVVLGPGGRPLGWGRPEDKAKRGRRVLAPIVDLGWYLRRGG